MEIPTPEEVDRAPEMNLLPAPGLLAALVEIDAPLDDTMRAMIQAGRTIETNVLLQQIVQQLAIIGAVLEAAVYGGPDMPIE